MKYGAVSCEEGGLKWACGAPKTLSVVITTQLQTPERRKQTTDLLHGDKYGNWKTRFGDRGNNTKTATVA